MAVPVLTFFNNKGGVGKTSLVYHLSWMFSNLGYRVLACDLDPQANLSAAFLDDDRLEALFDPGDQAGTVYKCVKPLTEVGDLRSPKLQRIGDRLSLIPGDLLLSGFEDSLSNEWPNALGSTSLYRPFRLLAAILYHYARRRSADGRFGHFGGCWAQSRGNQPFRPDRIRSCHSPSGR